MDPLTCIVTVSQLLVYALGTVSAISDLFQELKSKPEKLRGQLERISRLQTTLSKLSDGLISEGFDLREHLFAIVKTVKKLHSTLTIAVSRHSKNSTVKIAFTVLRGKQEDKNIQNIFRDLEQEETALILFINIELSQSFLPQNPYREKNDSREGMSDFGKENTESQNYTKKNGPQGNQKALMPSASANERKTRDNAQMSTPTPSSRNTNGKASDSAPQPDRPNVATTSSGHSYGAVQASDYTEVRQGNEGSSKVQDNGMRHTYSDVRLDGFSKLSQGNKYKN